MKKMARAAGRHLKRDAALPAGNFFVLPWIGIKILSHNHLGGGRPQSLRAPDRTKHRLASERTWQRCICDGSYLYSRKTTT
ncbi:hypothetical protein D7024_12345 [Desulfofundulus salinus]|uniref:Uncharacterized protein n=1 Tax=Desulfofundulus salinus TaxID=2419843 RepID=A0A494WXG5_9FIRM|nr:hypothetical protein D7024_12345 [Desulfofundulus salinum]